VCMRMTVCCCARTVGADWATDGGVDIVERKTSWLSTCVTMSLSDTCVDQHVCVGEGVGGYVSVRVRIVRERICARDTW
jgi:hypothetical protein